MLQLSITGTAVVGVYDPAPGRCRWARAGHMPPLLARAGAAASSTGRRGCCSAPPTTPPTRSSASSLQDDDLVLFYTDGLVERRAASHRLECSTG